MKFLRVSGLHYAASKQFPYKAKPALADCSYEEQLNSFFSSFLSYGDSLTHFLKPYGYSTSEILYDVEILQKKWAEENGCKFSSENWQVEILIQQIQKFKPDILFLYNSSALPASLIERRKEFFPFVRTLIFFRGYPEIDRPLLKFLSLADLLLVGSPVLEKIGRQNRLSPHLFYHYFDDRILSLIPNKEEKKIYPFTFIGTSGFGYGWNHQPRYGYLMNLLKTAPIECWIDEKPSLQQSFQQGWKEQIKRQGESLLSLCSKDFLRPLSQNYRVFPPIRKLAFNGLARKSGLENGFSDFPKVPLRPLFPKQCHPSVFGLDMNQILATSKITFNKHTFAASGTVDNIRLFEATGMGACLLTDHGSNLSSLFELDREVVSYSSIGECQEKLKYLLQNDKLRQEIASNGHKRTLRDHTASARARQMHELLKNGWA